MAEPYLAANQAGERGIHETQGSWSRVNDFALVLQRILQAGNVHRVALKSHRGETTLHSTNGGTYLEQRMQTMILKNASTLNFTAIRSQNEQDTFIVAKMGEHSKDTIILVSIEG